MAIAGGEAAGLSRLWTCFFPLVLELAGASPAGAEEPPSLVSPQARAIDFDLPAQPLAAALKSYAVLSGQSVVFIDELVAGLVSAPVHGRHTPRDALQALLGNTGLLADDVGGPQGEAFVLRREAGNRAASPVAAGRRDYDAALQVQVWRALCRDPLSAPGAYRAIVRFSVRPSGLLDGIELIWSTGDERRDAAIRGSLKALRMAPPPPGLPQPLTLALLPGAAGPAGACLADADAAGRTTGDEQQHIPIDRRGVSE